MTLTELLARAEADKKADEGRIAGLTKKRNDLAQQLLALRTKGELTDAEALDVPRIRSERDALDDQIDDLRERIANTHNPKIDTLRAEVADDERIQRESAISVPGAPLPRANGGNVTTTTVSVREGRTYTAERAAAGDTSFIRDLFAAQVKRDPEALSRLERHGIEARTDQALQVERAVNTGGVAGFVPPQYLTDLFAEYLRAGRPTANVCNGSVPLPAVGMKAYIPRITTPSATASQAAENGAVTSQDMDDTLLEMPVRTIAGMVDVSRQAIERGLMVESVVMADLAADYASQLDTQVIAGNGLNGTHTGILNTAAVNAVTYTDADPTLAELWPKVADAIGKIRSTRFTGPTHLVMHPTLWAWITAALATDGRPVVGGSITNGMGSQASADYAGVRTFQDVPVILDGNLPLTLGVGGNETAIIVGDFRDAYLLEDNGGAPVQLRFDDAGAGTLTSKLLVYGYSAFTAARQPKAFSVISGTGLIVPAL